ncbi:MAG: ABC transporter permease [Anaerolineaceae bacterium]|nr:ABC transporter permease [Anaerolineaceae bacterium]
MWRSWIILGLIIGLSLLAPLVTRYDPLKTDTNSLNQPPGGAHLLGTDLLGRDVFSRVLYSGRRSLLITMMAAIVAVLPGLCLGLLTGWLGGWIDRGMMTVVNALLAFPSLLLALVCLTLLGRGILPLALATGLAQIGGYIAVVRAAVIGVRSHQYVEAARAGGAADTWILLRHILPNIQGTLLGYAGVVFSYCLLNSAALSFLGLGGEPGIPDWGVMLAESRTAFRVAPWVSIVPGLAITLTVMAVNRLADEVGRLK